jgi:hypothetical protein
VEKPTSIKNIGLKNYLDQTAEQHNGYGYDFFRKSIEVPVPPTTNSLARTFNVSRLTMGKWLSIYKEEQKK